ncbi:hypothetical protein [Shewanella surugensis]|uniref:Uncharacterized protein n=1 Tax=Shewanella surugensis TaxID=212020 RepID=A0ABT0L9I0_9GAMM|nr:hypothetical protein [Shewanella surugensis]MCL1124334.1 hypothetical protein [Shewanella surugensis]
MVKSKVFTAKKMNYRHHSLADSALLKPRKKTLLARAKLSLKISYWLSYLTPLLLFIAFFISLYVAVLIGAKLAYFAPFPLNDDSAWMGSVQSSETIVPKMIPSPFES